MIVTELQSAILTLALDQLIQSRLGALGLLALILVTVGVKARNASCTSVGAVIFVLLMAQA